MLIKSADDRQPNLDALEALLQRPDVDKGRRREIETEIKRMRAGVKGERDAAYEIDFHWKDSSTRAVIHDLRLEVNGRVAQIDHLMINRLLDCWLFESKHFAEGVGINEHGEWVSYWGGRGRGIPSPIEQNKKHALVLRDAFKCGLVDLPKRLGVTLTPEIHPFVLVSAGAKISRPSSGRVDGLESVIKADQLKTALDDQIDSTSSMKTLASAARFVSAETLRRIAQELAALHRPVRVDWAARFGLPAMAPQPIGPLPNPTLMRAVAACGVCGAAVSDKVLAYCHDNSKRFAGRILCFHCQRRRSAGSDVAG